MQEIVHNSYNVADRLRVPMHLRPATNGDLFNHQSMLNSESDDCHSESDDYNIHFNQKPSQDFGLGYWMKHTNNHPRQQQSQLPHSKSPNHSAFIPKSNPPTNNSNKKPNRSDMHRSENVEKSKKSKHNSKVKKAKEKKSTTAKFNSSKSDYNIPRLKIPKDIVKKYLKTLSPLSSSSSSSSDSESSHNPRVKCHKIEKPKSKSKFSNQSKPNNSNLSDSPLSDHNDSSCLQTSFLSSKYSNRQPVYLLSVASHDIMHLSMTIDQKSMSNHISSLPVIINETGLGPSSSGNADSGAMLVEMADTDSSAIFSKSDSRIDNNNDTTIAIDNNEQIDEGDHSTDLLLEGDKSSPLTRCDNRQLNSSTNDNVDQNYNDFERTGEWGRKFKTRN